MSLLLRSTLRHLRQHAVQTGFTLAASALFIALFTALFCFTSSFQARLRENGVETKGTWHYQYYAAADSDTAVMLGWMAEELGRDPWFSDVSLAEDGEELHLFLTVASPGFFTTRQMEKKFDGLRERYRAAFQSTLVIGWDRNFDILISYGDLDKESGIYAFLLIFLLVFCLIAVIAVLTLAAVFGVSAAQREKDFALLAGIGADGRQIKGIMLMESGFYIGTSLPVGFLLGILLFWAGKAWFDALIYALERYRPVSLVIPVPFFIALGVSVSCVILGAGMVAARRAAVVSPMALLTGAEDILLAKAGEPAAEPQDARQRCGILRSRLSGQLGVEAFLAYRSCRRFRRRFRPVFLVLSATFALCFVLTGIRTFSRQVVEMTGSGMDYNISVRLYSDSLEAMDRLAEEIVASAGGELAAVRTARFELHPPVPRSAEAEATGLMSGQGALPDILLVSVQREVWESVCRENAIAIDPAGGGDEVQGIFIHADRRWRDADGIWVKGKPFGVKTGDRVLVYSSPDADAEAAAEIFIAGVAEDAPLYLDTEPASRMIVVVPEEAFLELEELRPNPAGDPGVHQIFLRGVCEDPFAIEQRSKEHIAAQGSVTGFVENYERALQRDRASVAGFQGLCGALVVLLAAASVCGNITVSWAVDMARKKEYAVLSGIGMRPEEMRRMRYWELCLQTAAAAVAGLPAGVLCYYGIYRIYATEYRLDWQFPWQGLAMGLGVLLVQALAAEAALRRR